MKRKQVRRLTLALMIALALLGMGAAKWTETLIITGEVDTGEVNAELSIEEVDNGLARGAPGGPSDNDLDEDLEAEGKDVAETTVSLDVTKKIMTIEVTKSYPCYHTYVDYDIHNTGSIPVKIESVTEDRGNLPSGATLELTGDAATVGTQIEPIGETGDTVYGTLHLHLDNTASENTTYTFTETIVVAQWNEVP
ncbi:MAG: hypothetical protein U9R11_04245 [Chloroflexota bacterium]|nr:hypothetical protein [Chloroflexota bacterium]